MERLDALKAGPLLEEASFKRFYFEVSEIIREYLGGRYGFDSLEMTTTELLATLRERPLSSVELSAVERFQSDCDLVKFAKYSPARPEAQECLEAAYRIVHATRPRETSAVILKEGVHAA